LRFGNFFYINGMIWYGMVYTAYTGADDVCYRQMLTRPNDKANCGVQSNGRFVSCTTGEWVSAIRPNFVSNNPTYSHFYSFIDECRPTAWV